ncbi:hypothetical protein EB093_09990, partial [bacterium]|nr:hypothetical protein [bacterium]
MPNLKVHLFTVEAGNEADVTHFPNVELSDAKKYKETRVYEIENPAGASADEKWTKGDLSDKLQSLGCKTYTFQRVLKLADGVKASTTTDKILFTELPTKGTDVDVYVVVSESPLVGTTKVNVKADEVKPMAGGAKKSKKASKKASKKSSKKASKKSSKKASKKSSKKASKKSSKKGSKKSSKKGSKKSSKKDSKKMSGGAKNSKKASKKASKKSSKKGSKKSSKKGSKKMSGGAKKSKKASKKASKKSSKKGSKK